MKDNFSSVSSKYALYRPDYPPHLFDAIYERVTDFSRAWDCATGNGQMAAVLSERFDHVYASDISSKQLENAVKKKNIEYFTASSENSGLSDQSIDLITVGQAVHWFDLDPFFAEVKRVLKPGGLLALAGYGLISINNEIDKAINRFYSQTLKGYWDPERKHIDDEYASIHIPLENVERRIFTGEKEWELSDLVGYLSTWSAVSHYNKQNGENIIDHYEHIFSHAWGKVRKRKVSFRYFLITGRNKKV